MPSFEWASLTGIPRSLSLLEPIKFRDGSYGRLRARFRSTGLDQRTIATEVIPGGAEVVTAAVRFVGKPARLRQMLEDAADGQVITYIADTVHATLPEYAGETTDAGNLAVDAEAFDGAAWSGAATVTADDVAAPDGTLAADKVEDTDGGAIETREQSIAYTAGDAVAVSVFVRQQTSGPTVRLRPVFLGGSTTRAPGVYFDPDAGTVAEITAPGTTALAFGATQVDASWWRIYWIGRSDEDHVTVQPEIAPAAAAAGVLGPDAVAATGFNHFWGVQAVDLGPEVPVRLDRAGALVSLTPDRDRFGLGEWEVEINMRRADGGTLAGLFPDDLT